MKIKRLLASLLVSILVITAIPAGVFADHSVTYTSVHNSAQLNGSGYIKLSCSNEIIAGYLTKKTDFFTTDFKAIYTETTFDNRKNALINRSSSQSTSYEKEKRRILTIRNTNNTIEGLNIEYITAVSWAGYGYNIGTATEPASNMFYFAKYPDTFPIQDLSTYYTTSTEDQEIYIRYVNTAIKDITPAARDTLAKAGAIYSDQLNKNYKDAGNQKALTDYVGKTYWCFNAEGNIIYGTTSNGLTLDSFIEITKEAYYKQAVNPSKQEVLQENKVETEQSNNYTSGNFTFVINQNKLACRKSSCWTCAQEAIVQNSGCLNGTGYQITGVVTDSSHAGWVKWSTLMGQDPYSPSIGTYTSYTAVMDMNGKQLDGKQLLSGTWSQGAGGDLDVQAGSSGGAYIIGWTNDGTTQYLKDMSVQQLQTVFKSFYNSGYWLTVGVRNYDAPPEPGAGASADTNSDFQSNHTVMFAGIKDNNHIMILDSAGTAEGTDGTKVEDYITAMDGAYTTYGLADGKSHNVVYVMAFKYSDEKCSLKNICGGTDAYMTEADQYNLQNMGINNKKGYFTEDQLSSKVVLSEADLSGVLSGATLDNLTQEDLESLQSWKDLTAEEDTLTKVIRIVVQVIGVVMLLWAILLYLGYHFDRTNNLIDISIVNILTLGKLRPVTSDSEEATFGKDKTEKKNKVSTVNSRNILAICLTVALFAVLILTGALYNILASLVVLINSFLRG